jgi:arsenite methyltransferase
VRAADVKACCAAAYSSEAARWLLGDSFHPGGAALTSRLARALGAGAGDTVVDVACGRGASALQLARETGCGVVGIDLSPDLVAEAAQAAREAALSSRVRFLQGDAEALPLPDEFADGVLCECAFCTFPGKRVAAAELARVLKPGGVLALADVVADPDRLAPALSSLHGRVACLGDARPLDEVSSLLERAGFEVALVERHDDALSLLLDRVEARLRLARVLDATLAARGLELAAAAREAIGAGALGYGVVVARRSSGPAEPAPAARRGAGAPAAVHAPRS